MPRPKKQKLNTNKNEFTEVSKKAAEKLLNKLEITKEVMDQIAKQRLVIDAHIKEIKKALGKK